MEIKVLIKTKEADSYIESFDSITKEVTFTDDKMKAFNFKTPSIAVKVLLLLKHFEIPLSIFYFHNK